MRYYLFSGVRFVQQPTQSLSLTLRVAVAVVVVVVESQFLIIHGKHPMFYYHLVLFLSSRED